MEIKSNDLRIGCIIYNTSNKAKRIKAINFDLQDAIVFDDDEMESLDLCKPIPISEDWLLKCGFDYDGIDKDNPYWDKRVYSLFNVVDGTGSFIVKICESATYGTSIDVFIDSDIYILYYDLEYIHQLQIIYFALTEQELEFKL